MPIEWRDGARQLHLWNDSLSYLMQVQVTGELAHLYLGARLATGRDYTHLARQSFVNHVDRRLDPAMLELPTAGRGDYRIPAIAVEHADGGTIVDLACREHRILPGKPALDGLPATYVEEAGEADSVEVVLADEPSGLRVHLLTTIWRDRPVLARSLRLVNGGDRPLTLTTAMSASLDLPDARWVLLSLTGAWGRERHVTETPLAPGRRSVGSQRGSSGHQQDPMLLVRRPETTEWAGEAIALSLVYSGNFLAEAEVDPFACTRLRIGLDPGTFRWRLDPGVSFQVPEAVLAWTRDGLGGISDALHPLFRERLVRGPWRDRPRPVLLNSWEATYHDFDEGRLLAIATQARALGVELFVVDDGWFGRRDDDASSLGDWWADERKLPSGLPALVERVRALGLGFGLWIEPEMVSPRSRLFEAHPEWAVGVPGRDRSQIRNQLVLDMSNPRVVDHLEGAIGDVLRSAPISLVKWDMNRPVTEPYGASLPVDRQGEFFHRFMLGVYDLHARLTSAFPDVLLEACAGGGGRFDPGILGFAPQVWTSDDTDAIERLRIQWGTSLVYPLSTMAAHVSAVPNHQVGRVTPIDTRAAVAFFGVLGYELDPGRLAEADRERVRDQVAWYAARRDLLQRGRFIRLRSPFEGDGNEAAWMVVNADRRRALVGWYRVLSRPMPGPSLLALRGLDPGTGYAIDTWPAADDWLARANGLVRGGDELMAVGLFLDDHAWETQSRGDFQARIFELRRVEP